MVLKIDAKFKEKLTCAFKNDIRNLPTQENKPFLNRVKPRFCNFY